MSEISQILEKLQRGDPSASEELMPLVYDELRQLARARLASERANHTLQPTALVHEAYLRLVGSANEVSWHSRGHFFAAAAEAMRRILIDAARARNAAKRSGGKRESLSSLQAETRMSDDALLDLNLAIDEFERSDSDAAKLLKLRFFGGFTMKEIAEMQGISVRKAHYVWDYGRAWLQQHLADSDT